MRRKSDLIVALKWLLPIFICLTLSIQAYRCDQTGKQSSNLRDPLVWNPNSLYDSNLDASNGLEKSLISSRRFKRSVSSSQSQPISFVDACQSRVEVITPFHATNSKGKLRTVVNSELMQQAIQIETCLRSPTSNNSKCNAQNDCGCEQKYKWHRLLVLDANKNSGSNQKALFMDWFLFPSSCVCRCRYSNTNSRQFLKAIQPQPSKTTP